jgi:hypothetical protein
LISIRCARHANSIEKDAGCWIRGARVKSSVFTLFAASRILTAIAY